MVLSYLILYYKVYSGVHLLVHPCKVRICYFTLADIQTFNTMFIYNIFDWEVQIYNLCDVQCIKIFRQSIFFATHDAKMHINVDNYSTNMMK